MRLAVVLACALAAGCADGNVFLAIDVKTDLVPGRDFDRIAVNIEQGTRPHSSERMRSDIADAVAFARGTRVTEVGPIPTGEYRVRVELEREGREVIRRLVQIELRENTAVVVVLPSMCVGITCPPDDHPDWTTCGDDGTCVDPRCSADAPEYCPSRDAGPPPPPIDTGPPPPVDTGPPACPEGAPCDDGNACTHGDRCDAAGACGGTGITCNSDACNVRACNGTASCSLTQPAPPAGCADDANVCTADWCDGMGGCIHAALDFFEPGHQYGSHYFERCCGGVPRFVIDEANCGGCGINCAGRGCVDLGFGFASCRCSSNAECGGTSTCYDGNAGCTDPDGRGWLCQCQNDSDCAPGARCMHVGCRHWCHYG